MKKYTLIDNEKNKKSEYGLLEWNIAWLIVFAMGVITGYCI